MIIEVYGRAMCPTCEYATNLLDSQGVPYRYYNLENLPFDEVQYIIVDRADGNSIVPIIFIDGRRINGINELKQFFENAAPNLVDTGNLH